MDRHTLMSACALGNLETVRNLWSNGNVEFNVKNDQGWTPLMMATNNRRCDIVEYLCSIEGVDVNLNGREGWTPLMLAVRLGSIELVKCLCLNRKVGINVKDDNGESALRIATDEGHFEIVEYLCSIEEVDVNMKGNDGWTALMVAAKFGPFEVVKCLCSNEDVDINVKNDQGWTPLLMAANNRQWKIVEYLCSIEGIDVNMKGNDGWTAMMVAAKFGPIEVVKHLFSNGDVDINLQDNQGWTSLMMATHQRRYDVVEYLCSIDGIDVNVKGIDGWTALMMAAKFGSIEVVKYLCSNEHIDINVKDNQGWTPLMIATEYGRYDIVEYLCSIEGIDVNTKGIDGRIAVIMATTSGSIEVVKCLCSHGDVDINVKNDQGWTPLMMASHQRRCDIVEYLCSIDGVDVNVKGIRGCTALMMAAERNYIEFVKCLCSNENVDVNLKDDNGLTALRIACNNDHCEIVKYLCSIENIDVCIKDNYGMTTLMAAACRGNKTTISGLCSNSNVDINAKDDKGRTGFELAALNGHPECVEYLSSQKGFKVSNTTESLILCTLQGNVTDLEILVSEISGTEDNLLEVLLVIASANGNIGCVNYLLSTNVNVNGCDRFPRTPLMLASMNGHIECVKCLISNPAVNVWKVDKDGLTAFFLAIKNGHASCLPLFVDIRDPEEEPGSNVDTEGDCGDTRLSQAFKVWTTGTSTLYKPGTPWKYSLKGKHPKEKPVLDLVIRNGLALCPFCFILVDRNSVESPCRHSEIERQLNYCTLARMPMSPQKEMLQLASEFGRYECLVYGLRYCRLFCHMLYDLKNYVNRSPDSIYLFPGNSDSNCHTCQAPTPMAGVRRKCVDCRLSECITLDEREIEDTPVKHAVFEGHHRCTRLLVKSLVGKDKTCDSIKNVFLQAARHVKKLKYLSIFLKNGIFHWSWYPEFPVDKLRYLSRELVIHGYSQAHFERHKQLQSPLQRAFHIGDLGLVKYLVANLYLRSDDMEFLKEMASNNLNTDTPEEIRRLHQLSSTHTPWSLQALSFLVLSSSLKCQRRNPDMMKGELQIDLQRRLTFTNPIRMLCVKQWGYILSDSITADTKTKAWLHDRFLLLGETFATPEPTDALRYGQCCNGNCRVIKSQLLERT